MEMFWVIFLKFVVVYICVSHAPFPYQLTLTIPGTPKTWAVASQAVFIWITVFSLHLWDMPCAAVHNWRF